jgi:hypothetical protein
MYAVKLQTYRLGYTGQQESSTAMYHRSEVRKTKKIKYQKYSRRTSVD